MYGLVELMYSRFSECAYSGSKDFGRVKCVVGLTEQAFIETCTLSEKKRLFNGSSEWSKVLPGTFCYLNQAKGSPNYTQL